MFAPSTSASTAPSDDAEAPVGDSAYGDGSYVMSPQEVQSAIARNKTMQESLLNAGISNATMTIGLELCNELYPNYHDKFKAGVRSPFEDKKSNRERRSLQTANTCLLRLGGTLLRDQNCDTSGSSVGDYPTLRERCQISYAENKVMFEQVENWDRVATPEEKNTDFTKCGQNLREYNETLDRMNELKDAYGDMWTEKEEAVCVRILGDFEKETQALRDIAQEWMYTAETRRAHRRASQNREQSL